MGNSYTFVEIFLFLLIKVENVEYLTAVIFSCIRTQIGKREVVDMLALGNFFFAKSA